MAMLFITEDGDNVRVLFRIPFFKYFICKNYTYMCLAIAVKYWDGYKYKWREL